MEKPPTALATAILPQYQASAAFMERFLIAAHFEGVSIERSQNDQKIKLVDGAEIDSDMLDYFLDNRDAFRDEFLSELNTKIPLDESRAFCETVAEEWFDGKRLRETGRCRQLKFSVYEYFRLLGYARDSLVHVDNDFACVEPLITPQSVAAILTVNDQMLYRHIDAWKQQRSVYREISQNDIFLRRGLALSTPIIPEDGYKEWDFINSYSIAFSAPEKFAQMMDKRIPAIVNGEISLFSGRVLFFSPFVPNMDVGQLELGIIPSEQLTPIHSQGSHGGIQEYILDPAPFQVDRA
jgi:hypothetical protein